MNNSILKVCDLDKKYKSGKGIENISFEVPKGTIVGIVGLNGAGKTTLLSTIIGFIEKDKGSIKYQFDKENPIFLQPAILNQIGIVMREQGFPEHFTAVTISKIMRHIYTCWNDKRFFTILSEFSINPIIKIKQYSTGMKSVLSLAIALSHHVSLLVLDEALEGLDVLARKKIRDYLFEFVESGEHSVLFTTHELGEVEKIADRILLIDKGKILLDLDKDELRYQYKVFKVTSKQYENIDISDLIYAKKEEFFISVLPKDTKGFVQKYDIELCWDSVDKIFEMILEGERNEGIDIK